MLDSYEKASQDILSCLKTNPMILIINAVLFKTIIAIAKQANLSTYNCTSFQVISILEIVPNIYSEIEITLPYPSKKDLTTTNHFITELVAGCGRTWIPVGSYDYQRTLSTKFQDDLDMVHWQRYVRASESNDLIELTILSIDPTPSVRNKATSRLKTTYL